MDTIGRLMGKMIDYYAADPRRVNHFLKVYGFAKAIGEMEGVNAETQQILEIAALTHDIGIKNSETKYGSSGGHYQQIEGPPEAKKLFATLDMDPAIIDRVCWLIARHHTYTDIQGIDYQILVEADFLANIYEDDMPHESIRSICDKIFRTESGKKMLHTLYTF
jgi:HD superfamily phosphodiesterase